MNWKVILAVIFLSVAGAVVSNLVSPDPVEWMGSPRVLPKPEGV